jgi:hypothetical protein
MTRRGSIAYCLAAWVIGSFIVALVFSFASDQSSSASVLIELYFFALIAGAVDLLLFALLLRRIMRLLGTHRLWAWALAGAGLFAILTYLLAGISQKLPEALQIGMFRIVANIVFSGPQALRLAGLWQAPIEGALMATVLCLVDRAFDRPAEVAPGDAAANAGKSSA